MSAQTGWRLRQQTPSPENDPSNTRPKTRPPRPDASRPRGGASSTASSSSSSSKSASYSTLVRTPSRTQLRHATAARRLSGEGFVSNGECSSTSAGGSRVKDAPPPPVADENCTPSRNDSEPRAGPSFTSQASSHKAPQALLRRNSHDSTAALADNGNNNFQPQPQETPQRPKLKRSPGSVTASEIIYALATGKEPSLSSATRPSAADQEYYRALAQKADARARQSCAQSSNEHERQAPLLPKTLQAVGVDLMIDSTNLKSELIIVPKSISGSSVLLFTDTS